MRFLKTKKGAVLVLLLAVVFGVVFGTWRSVRAEKQKVEVIFDAELIELFEVKSDAGHNLYSVLERYFAQQPKLTVVQEELLEGLRLANYHLRKANEIRPTSNRIANHFEYAAEVSRISALLAFEITTLEREGVPMGAEVAQHYRGLMQELESWTFAIAHCEPYHVAAYYYNETVLNPLAHLMGFTPLECHYLWE